MDKETEALFDRWVLRFCEPPVVLDPELMRRLLAEEAQPRSDSDDREDVQGR
jgi:hypothetical protein